jgi:hypothetical protein
MAQRKPHRVRNAKRSGFRLHPIAPLSEIGRWIGAHEIRAIPMDQALADFARHLRDGDN